MPQKLLYDLFQAYYDCRKHKRNTKQAYILKLDIAGFFMEIDHEILWNKLKFFIEEIYKIQPEEKEILLYLCEKIVFHTPQESYIKRSTNESWLGLPKNKSLFFTK